MRRIRRTLSVARLITVADLDEETNPLKGAGERSGVVGERR
jgi:hypothetical protein